jgi:hypothetical protein
MDILIGDDVLIWYHARDVIVGQNGVHQDVEQGLELASCCTHPDALWLTELFAGREVKTKERAKQVFFGEREEARSLCFGGLLSWSWDPLKRSAQFGYAYAQALLAIRPSVSDRERFAWAQKAAAQKERDGKNFKIFLFKFTCSHNRFLRSWDLLGARCGLRAVCVFGERELSCGRGIGAPGGAGSVRTPRARPSEIRVAGRSSGARAAERVSGRNVGADDGLSERGGRVERSVCHRTRAGERDRAGDNRQRDAEERQDGDAILQGTAWRVQKSGGLLEHLGKEKRGGERHSTTRRQAHLGGERSSSLPRHFAKTRCDMRNLLRCDCKC